MVIDSAMPLTFSGRYAEARDRVKRGIYLDPNFFYGPWTLGWFYIEEGRSKDAIPVLRHATELESPAYTLAWLGYAYGASGDRAQALSTIDAMKQRFPGGRIPPYCLALVYLGLGDHVQALMYLEQARAADTQWLGFIKMSHLFDPLRSEPRFLTLMKAAGLTPQ